MAKFVFYYGSMNSGKSAHLIMTAHNFKQQNKPFVALKSTKDTRDVEITSRALSISLPCVPIANVNDIYTALQDYQAKHGEYPAWIFVDEVQLMSTEMVDALAAIANKEIDVICYGLLTDFTGHLFKGTARAIECADSIREIKNQCFYCKNKAIRNMRLADNKPVFDGDVILPGNDYVSVCRTCFDQFRDEYYKNEERCNHGNE